VVRCEPGWSWQPRRRDLKDFDLWFVWKGSGTLSWRGRVIDLRPGVIFCLRPGESYDARHDPARRLGVCYVHFDFVDAAGRPRRPVVRPPLHRVLEDVSFYEGILRRAVDLACDAGAARGALAEANLLLRVVLQAMCCRAPARELSALELAQAEQMAAVMRHIRQCGGELFSVAELAGSCGYSVDHFCRLFQQVAGVSPKEFCIRARMRRAGTLLREGVLSVQAVAQELGYADVFFFSRQFKQRMGVPPSRWRRQTHSVAM
jgi:AraC-like DNA-binding protein